MQATTAELLRDAVHHNPAGSRRGVSERAFTFLFKGFVYNQIWEDPEVDAEALRLDSESRILTISSGGCNVLNYLLKAPEKIVAIDLNTSHMSLTRLKLAAARHLADYETFYNFFGHGNHRDNLRVYDNDLRWKLDEVTRQFWDNRPVFGKLGRRRINYFANGFYERAKLGLFLRFVHTLARVVDCDPNRLLEARTLAEQRRIFDEVYDPFFDTHFIRLIGRMPATLFSLGIPPSQHQIMRDEAEGDIVDCLRKRVRKLACDFPLEDNYFAWQAFGRRYDEKRRALPAYLKEENFSTLRANLDRVETHITCLSAHLQTLEPGALNRFVLLDSQDWMPPEVIAELWREIARVGESGSRIIFRTAGKKSPIESSLPPDLLRRFECEKDLARRLHDQDRSAIYGMFHVYSLR